MGDGARKKISRTAIDTTKATSENLTQSTKAASKRVDIIVETNVRRPIKNATNVITEPSREIVDTVTSSGTKLLRWVWWWSLAVVFVYGVATTLPMAIIRHTIEQKKKWMILRAVVIVVVVVVATAATKAEIMILII